MSFADSSQSPSTPSIHLTADEFEMIFQVTKELHVLPEAVLEGAGWGNADVERLLSVARGIRGRVEGIPFVRVETSGPEIDSDPPAPPSVSEASQGKVSVKEVVAMLPYRIGRGWQRMAEAVVSSLGQRELFLRTGYQMDDILAAVRRLTVDVSCETK